MIIKPKNWQDFQHYKDRCPPWIRLHKTLLDNMDYALLSAESAKILPLLWLIASDTTEGVINSDYERIAFRVRMPEELVEKCISEILERGFFIEGSLEQVATPAQTKAQSIGWGSRHISDSVKREVWERDHGKCCSCQSTDSIEYDHKIPVSKGGGSNADNIQLLCRPCNRKKRTKTAEQVATPAQPWLNIRTSEAETEAEAEAEKNIANGKPNCPHQEIINLYHETLPASPRIKDWTPARAASLRARWNESTDRQTLDYWKSLFEYIAGIPFLTGRVSGNGRKPFVLSLDWLLKAENFAKVREGRYEDALS